MSKQAQIFTVKIVGLISIIYSLPLVGKIAEAYAIKSTPIFENEQEQAQMFLIAIASAITPVVLLIITGIILIVFSEKIVSFLSPNLIEKEETDLSNFQSVAISIIGIVLVAFSIPDIAYVFLQYRFLLEAGDQSPYDNFSISTKAELIAQIIQFLIGLTLFFGSKGFSSLWYFLQKARPMSKINMNKST